MRLNCFANSFGKDLPKTEQLVVFEPLEPLMNDYLGREYYECQRFYNSFSIGTVEEMAILLYIVETNKC